MKYKNTPTIFSITFIIVIWQVVATKINNESIFPTLYALAIQTIELLTQPTFYQAVFFTILRGAIGITISFFIALLFASIASRSDFWKHFFYPIIITIRSVPVISVVLIALIWFNPNQLPVFIAFLTMIPILYQSIILGFEQVDIRLVEMAQVFGKTKLQTFWNFYLPSTKKQIVAGIITAAGFGWRAIVVGEVLAQPLHGIGTGMKLAQVYLNVSELFAWTIITIFISYVFEQIIKQITSIKFIYPKTKQTTKKVHKIYDKSLIIRDITIKPGENIILNNKSFDFYSEKVYLIKSPSGAGKTTLLKSIAGILIPISGSVSKQNIFSTAFSFQDARLCNWLTNFENIVFTNSTSTIKPLSDDEFLNQLTNALEISDILSKYPVEISGGQKQRIALARALYSKADLILLDEPLNGLDTELKKRIMSYIDEYLITYKPLVIWATHEDIILPHSKTRIFSV